MALVHIRAFVEAVREPEEGQRDYVFDLIECRAVEHDLELEAMGDPGCFRCFNDVSRAKATVSREDVITALAERQDLGGNAKNVTTMLLSISDETRTAEEMLADSTWHAFHITFAPVEHTH